MFNLYLRSKRKLRWIATIGYIVIILFTTSPILSVVLAATIADSHGCTLNEGSVNPCIIGGVDYGGLLYNMGVLGWFAMVSIPLGIAGFIVLTIKVRHGSRFLNQASWYAMCDLKNLTAHQFDERLFLEADVDHNGEKKRLQIFFKNITEQRKFTNHRGTYIGGLLKNDSNVGTPVLYNAIVTSK